MTIAPPTPSRPATNAPPNPSASRVRANASVTGSAPSLVGPALTQARVVRPEIPDLVVRDRLHQRFERLERLIRGVPAVGLEQEHLVPEIAGGLPAQVGTTLRGIPSAGLAVANRALLGRRATPFDGCGVRPHRRGLARLAREVGGEVVNARLDHVLCIRLHLGRWPPARGVVLDRFLKYQGAMPAMIGIVLDGLWPPGPWHALQASALAAPGPSSGPAAATPATRTTPRLSEPATRRMVVRIGRSLLRPRRECPARCSSPSRPRAGPTRPTGWG